MFFCASFFVLKFRLWLSLGNLDKCNQPGSYWVTTCSKAVHFEEPTNSFNKLKLKCWRIKTPFLFQKNAVDFFVSIRWQPNAFVETNWNVIHKLIFSNIKIMMRLVHRIVYNIGGHWNNSWLLYFCTIMIELFYELRPLHSFVYAILLLSMNINVTRWEIFFYFKGVSRQLRSNAMLKRLTIMSIQYLGKNYMKLNFVPGMDKFCRLTMLKNIYFYEFMFYRINQAGNNWYLC